jgi:hypothetical protein
MGIKKYYNTTKEQDKDGASPLVSLNDVVELINEMIENYRTMYGVKKETVIQSAFIYELKNLKQKLEDSPKP